MGDLFNLFTKIVEVYGVPGSIILVTLIIILYGLHLIIKSYPALVTSCFDKIFKDKSEKHTNGAIHRKTVTPKVRAELLDLASTIKADRALVFEFSNGSSNLVGLPFLYMTVTCEVTTPNTPTVGHQYQKMNTAIFSEFLEKLEEKGYFYVKDIDETKESFPVLYNFMKPNDVKSVLFYSLYGINDTMGFIVATTVKDKEFTREDALPRMAGSAQIISSLLNFDMLHDKL